jgi:phospholipase C
MFCAFLIIKCRRATEMYIIQQPAKDYLHHLQRSNGIKVPALEISSWAGGRAVSHTVFDHTSILKTILFKFCRNQ